MNKLFRVRQVINEFHGMYQIKSIEQKKFQYGNDIRRNVQKTYLNWIRENSSYNILLTLRKWNVQDQVHSSQFTGNSYVINDVWERWRKNPTISSQKNVYFVWRWNASNRIDSVYPNCIQVHPSHRKIVGWGIKWSDVKPIS